MPRGFISPAAVISGGEEMVNADETTELIVRSLAEALEPFRLMLCTPQVRHEVAARAGAVVMHLKASGRIPHSHKAYDIYKIRALDDPGEPGNLLLQFLDKDGNIVDLVE
jgi:hypothetical protein